MVIEEFKKVSLSAYKFNNPLKAKPAEIIAKISIKK